MAKWNVKLDYSAWTSAKPVSPSYKLVEQNIESRTGDTTLGSEKRQQWKFILHIVLGMLAFGG